MPIQFLLRRAAVLALTLASSMSFAYGHDFSIGKLDVRQPIARATMPGQTAAALYLTLENTGTTSDRLLTVKTTAAKSAEIHSMIMRGDVMQMREVGTIALKPGEKIAMAPGGGYHIMLLGLRQPLRVGDRIALQLHFEKAGSLAVQAQVEAFDSAR